MTHPAPNSELTPESVKLLKAGDVLRYGTDDPFQLERIENGDAYGTDGWVQVEVLKCAFIGRPDADGWIPHDGGPNPVPWYRVDVRLRDGTEHSGASENFSVLCDWWRHEGRSISHIIAFRPHAAPSVERGQDSFADAHTHRATDGLSGKLDRLQGASERMAEARAKLTPHTSSWPQMDRATNDFHNALNALDHDDCLKLIEAARASQVGMEREARNEPKPDVAGARERLEGYLEGELHLLQDADLRLILSAYDRQADEYEACWQEYLAERRARMEANAREAAQGEEIERLRGLLKPFADFADDMDTRPNGYPWKDDQHVLLGLTAGDFRAARARQGGPDHG